MFILEVNVGKGLELQRDRGQPLTFQNVLPPPGIPKLTLPSPPRFKSIVTLVRQAFLGLEKPSLNKESFYPKLGKASP